MIGARSTGGLWLRIALGFAAGLTLLFLLRAIFFATIWMESDPQRHAVEAWMTPRYIVRTYGLPPDRVDAALGLPTGQSPRKPLADIAERQGLPVAHLIAAVEALRDEGERQPGGTGSPGANAPGHSGPDSKRLGGGSGE
ncbi:hypothetical protein [Szabonella alba]|uniref:Uncharacterized protein n=1 Tax=Szabonella alba TaxID=2804194 RepID=A0A8K0V815_9RHOB|nr:hypothetical protein [Szabonella alba]MBL4917424.1 hypothetical protein [Szabonella alba]